MIVVSEYKAAQTPFFTKARYQVVAVRLLNTCDKVVLAMFAHVEPLLVLNSHLTTDPTLPVSVMVPVLLVAHTVVSLFVTPATVKLSIVKITVSLLFAQTPLLIVQLKEYTPGTKLVMLDVGSWKLEKTIAVGPLTWLHVPVPLLGVLPFKFMVAGKHNC